MLYHIARYFFPELFHKERPFRSWPYQAHVSPQNVKQLGKLVNTCPAHKFPDSRNPGIVLYRPRFFLLRFRLDLHGAEFVHTKRLIMEADPFLLVDQRSGRRSFDQNAHQEHHRRRHDDRRNRTYDIHGSFYHGIKSIAQRHIPDINYREAENIFCIWFGRYDFIVIGNKFRMDA